VTFPEGLPVLVRTFFSSTGFFSVSPYFFFLAEEIGLFRLPLCLPSWREPGIPAFHSHEIFIALSTTTFPVPFIFFLVCIFFPTMIFHPWHLCLLAISCLPPLEPGWFFSFQPPPSDLLLNGQRCLPGFRASTLTSFSSPFGIWVFPPPLSGCAHRIENLNGEAWINPSPPTFSPDSPPLFPFSLAPPCNYFFLSLSAFCKLHCFQTVVPGRIPMCFSFLTGWAPPDFDPLVPLL